MSFSNCKVVKDNCSHDEYGEQTVKRGNPGFIMSRSELVEFFLNPKRWLDGFGLPDEETEEEESTPSLDWGSLIDALISGVGAFEARFAVAPATYTNSKGGQSKWTTKSKECAEWEAEQKAAGLIVIRAPIMAKAEKAVAAIKADPDLTELLNVSRKQVLIAGTWTDKETGIKIPLRALPDLVPQKDHPVFGKWVCDFKTARNGNPAKWARVVDDESYDVQAALHFDLYLAASKEDRTTFVHVVQENIKPFHIVKPFPAVTLEFLAWGRAKYQAALRQYARCLATGEWPSYQTQPVVFGGVQLIAPDELWNYRKMAGQGSFDRGQYRAPEPEAPADDNAGLTP